MNIKNLSLAGLVLFAGLIFSFHQKTPAQNNQIKKGMIKVTILYPNGDGKKFDMDYYSKKHMPMVAGLMGDSLKLFGIDKGLSGRNPTDPAPYVAIGYFYFDRLSAYQNVMRTNAEKIRGDIPNYTDIQPVIQISEVLQ